MPIAYGRLAVTSENVAEQDLPADLPVAGVVGGGYLQTPAVVEAGVVFAVQAKTGVGG